VYAAFLHADWSLIGSPDRGRPLPEDKSFIGGQADLNAFSYKFTGCYPFDAVMDLLPAFSSGHPIPSVSPVNSRFPEADQPLRYFLHKLKQDFSIHPRSAAA
jgi:hypothetical protein